MEAIFSILESIASASGVELWVKVIAMAVILLLGGGVSIFYWFQKRKIRKNKADENASRDTQADSSDNVRVETQNQTDGQSVRDRLRGK